LVIVDVAIKTLKTLSDDSGITFEKDVFDRALDYIILTYIIDLLFRGTVGVALLRMGSSSDSSDVNDLGYVGANTDDEELPQPNQPITKGPEGSADISSYAKNIISVPAIVCVFSIILSSIPAVKSFMTTKETFFYSTIFVATNMVGKSVKIMLMFLFGAHLALGKEVKESKGGEDDTINVVTHALTVLGKIVVLPAIGFGLIYYVVYQHFQWVTDPILLFFMII
jgi:hypothetical protein